jgi:hypothetical protein
VPDPAWPPRALRIAAVLLALGATALLFAGGRAPEAGTLFPPPWDKLAHAAFFGALAGLWYLGLGARGLLLPFLLSFLTGCADELHQSTLPARHADPWDLLADAAGAMLVLAALPRLLRRPALAQRSGPGG